MGQDLRDKLCRPWGDGGRILGADLVGPGILKKRPGLRFCQRDLYRLIQR